MTRLRSPPAFAALLLPLLLPLAGPRAVRAGPGCGASDSAAGERRGSWSPPLSQTVSLSAREISLREALDRLAAAARLRLSYSAEALPLDRRVCVNFKALPVGDALTRLLAGAPVRLVVLSEDHVVLAPGLVEAAAPERPPVQLDRIVVTGSADDAAERALPIAIDVLDGRELAQRSANTVSQSFNAMVPGLWVWEQSPVSLLAQYGSIRGASSFGSSYPKVYLDGIQLANPLLLTRIMPAAVERIEVIRGPQGAALYGADAISGVTNIISRHDAAAGGPQAQLSAGLGLAGSAYADPALQQDYGLSLRAGSNVRSATLTVAAGSVGAFLPSVYSRSLSAVAAGRLVGSASILTGTLRFFGLKAGTARSPVLDRVLGPLPDSLAGAGLQTLGEFTGGVTAKFFPSDRWEHALTAGVDGYVLNGVPDARSPIPSAEAAALADARGAAARATFRASSVLKLGQGPGTNGRLTFSAEQSLLRERAVVDQLMPPGGHAPQGGITSVVQQVRWRGNTGFTTQANAALYDQLFLTAGVRLERDEAATGGRWATLPMVGASWARERGRLAFKLRTAYGKGIRWPETPARETLWEGLRPGMTLATLAPEEQSGIEAGADLVVAQALKIQITRFDQTASGLIQRVMVPGDTSAAPPPGARRIAFQLQNVGEITNRGWELQGSLRRGALALTAGFSQVDSRVRKLAAGYTGDLRPGDRMLEVPARTASFSAAWSGSRWQGSLTAYRAFSWINYDRVALAQAYAGNHHPPRDFMGLNLRNFWKTYPGVTRLSASVSTTLRRSLGLTLSGDNLFNQQTGEPDNITVIPGRSFSIGLRLSP